VCVCVLASKKHATGNSNPYTDELKLAVTWNRVDIAKSELFNGNIDWKVEDCGKYTVNQLLNWGFLSSVAVLSTVESIQAKVTVNTCLAQLFSTGIII